FPSTARASTWRSPSPWSMPRAICPPGARPAPSTWANSVSTAVCDRCPACCRPCSRPETTGSPGPSCPRRTWRRPAWSRASRSTERRTWPPSCAAGARRSRSPSHARLCASSARTVSSRIWPRTTGAPPPTSGTWSGRPRPAAPPRWPRPAGTTLLIGPPGAGKTMIASRIPGILPPLGTDDALAVSAIHSVAGRFDALQGLRTQPPFENPHHIATPAAVVGGGPGIAMPGAISRAHAGVLLLDEAPEFPARVLEALREPLEAGDITIHRARGVTRYPARFQLVLAANPCPCGKAFGRGDECRCTPLQRRRYLARLSGPVLDRIDMRITVGPVDIHRSGGIDAEPSAVIAERVASARARQRERFADHPWATNARLPGPELRRSFAPEPDQRRL